MSSQNLHKWNHSLLTVVNGPLELGRRAFKASGWGHPFLFFFLEQSFVCFSCYLLSVFYCCSCWLSWGWSIDCGNVQRSEQDRCHWDLNLKEDTGLGTSAGVQLSIQTNCLDLNLNIRKNQTDNSRLNPAYVYHGRQLLWITGTCSAATIHTAAEGKKKVCFVDCQSTNQDVQPQSLCPVH